MTHSIKRKEDDVGITAGKDYPILGYSGGAVILNDDGKFQVVGFDRVDNDWEVTSSEAQKSKKDKVADEVPVPITNTTVVA